jgi:hypothetical protein
MKLTTLVCGVAVATVGTIATLQLAAQTRIGREDCASYTPATLQLVEERGSWLISREDGARFMVLDTKADADLMMEVFKAHSALCYVGRDNKRSNRDRYVFHYWK